MQRKCILLPPRLPCAWRLRRSETVSARRDEPGVQPAKHTVEKQQPIVRARAAKFRLETLKNGLLDVGGKMEANNLLEEHAVAQTALVGRKVGQRTLHFAHHSDVFVDTASRNAGSVGDFCSMTSPVIDVARGAKTS